MSERATDAGLILRAAVAAADPGPAVHHAVRAAAELRGVRRIHLLAMGKAGALMAAAAIDVLPRSPDSALVIVPRPTRHTAVPVRDPAHIEVSPYPAPTRVLHAAHPIPDVSSVEAAAQVERQLADTEDDDVVLVLLSGGASSLVAAPAFDITIDEYATLVRGLMDGGADIEELNMVRAHMDRLKCGGLARAAAPACVLGLIVSDVVGNPLHVIASGPLTPCPSHTGDAVRVLERYGLWSGAPSAVRRALQSEGSVRRRGHEAGAAFFPRVTTRVILDNATAVAGAAEEARRLGYDVRISRTAVVGSARDAGTRIATEARSVAGDLQEGDRAVCLVYGGETTVTVTGSGLGGRNQELVLAAAMELDGEARITIGSLGTDGIDGPTDAAGAIAGGETVARARRVRLEAAESLANNDSHSFFLATGGLIRTGPTGTNVMDVQVALVDPPPLRDRD